MPSITAAMAPGDHVCGLFADRAEQELVVAEFVADGLRGNDKVLLIGDDADTAQTLRRVGGHGVDVAQARGAGQLQVVGMREAYLADGRFEPEAILATLDAAKDAARAEGYRHLRATGDMTWALGGAPGVDRLVEYEALLNRHVARSNLYGICQYDMSRFPAATLLELLAVHPKAVLERQLVDNFYYMPPEEFLGPGRDDAMLRRWLANLDERRRADEVRERAARAEASLRAQRELAALRRRFLNQASHELRTPLTPMLVRLRVLGLDPTLRPDQRRQVAGLEQGAKRLAVLAADLLEALRLEGDADAFRPAPTDLAGLLQEAAQACAADARNAGGHIEVRAQPVEAWVEGGRLRMALAYLAQQAVAHTPAGGAAVLELRADGDDAILRVTGPPQPSDGTTAGEDRWRGGLDLPGYLLKLVVERHGGSVSSEAGVVREVRLPIANRGDRPGRRPARRGEARRRTAATERAGASAPPVPQGDAPSRAPPSP